MLETTSPCNPLEGHPKPDRHEVPVPQGTSGSDLPHLLARARAAGRDGIGELLQRYRNYMHLVAATKIDRRLQSRISASDVVQETMLKAHRHFAQFQGQSEPELLGWLRQILLMNLASFVQRHILTEKRNVLREIPIERSEATVPDAGRHVNSILSDHAERPSTGIQRKEDAGVLNERLAALPARYREVLRLRNLEGLSFDEIAVRLGRSPGATRMLWLRAIERLRAIYRRAESHVK